MVREILEPLFFELYFYKNELDTIKMVIYRLVKLITDTKNMINKINLDSKIYVNRNLERGTRVLICYTKQI